MTAYKKKFTRGFALVEILIAVTILSIVLLSVFSGVSTSIKALSDNRNQTLAMIIAKSKMNEFIIDSMRGPDISDEPVQDHQGFTLSRETKRFEHPLMGPLPVKKTDISVKWKTVHFGNRERLYSISYIFASQ
jgi:type II secretion system protein I